MTTLLSAALAAALLAGSAAAQDSQAIDVEMFNAIEAGGGFELVIEPGETRSVVLEGTAGDFDQIEIRVRNGELQIGQDTGWFGNRRQLDVVVRVTAADLTGLDFHRGIQASAAGLEADHLELDVNTGALVTLAGRCTRLELDLYTGGALNARDLVCAQVSVDASTGGTASVHATDRIEADGSMGAEIRVFGNPAARDTASSMGAEVRFD